MNRMVSTKLLDSCPGDSDVEDLMSLPFMSKSLHSSDGLTKLFQLTISSYSLHCLDIPVDRLL